MNQSFETIDWPAEASRLVAAFEIDEVCEFVHVETEEGDSYLLDSIEESRWPNTSEYEIQVIYSKEGRNFTVLGNSGLYGNIELSWENTPIYDLSLTPEASPILARAFFKLGFLTPELEAALNVSITAHQKLEWTLAYQQRLKSAGQI